MKLNATICVSKKDTKVLVILSLDYVFIDMKVSQAKVRNVYCSNSASDIWCAVILLLVDGCGKSLHAL
jgi:hypothetical protein